MPWIGDLLNEASEALKSLQRKEGLLWSVSPMVQVRSKACEISRLLAECVNGIGEGYEMTQYGDTAALVKLWGDLSSIPLPKSFQ